MSIIVGGRGGGGNPASLNGALSISNAIIIVIILQLIMITIDESGIA